jgi:prefoldin subunit 1
MSRQVGPKCANTKHRFVCTSIPDVQKRLTTETGKLNSDLENLAKKEDYLEKTFKNSKEHLEQVLRGGRS